MTTTSTAITNQSKKKLKKLNTNGMAIIDFALGGNEAVEKFVKAFDGAPIQVKGELQRAKVEFAMNQRVPLGAQQKKATMATQTTSKTQVNEDNTNENVSSSSPLLTDEDFQSFKKLFEENGGRIKKNVSRGPVQPRDIDASAKDEVKLSALVNFVAKKRFSYQQLVEKERKKEEEELKKAKQQKKNKSKKSTKPSSTTNVGHVGGGGGGGNITHSSSLTTTNDTNVNVPRETAKKKKNKVKKKKTPTSAQQQLENIPQTLNVLNKKKEQKKKKSTKEQKPPNS